MGRTSMLPFLVMGILLAGMLAVVAFLLSMATWRLRRPGAAEVEVADYPAAAFERQKHLGARMGEAGFVFAGMQREERVGGGTVWQALFRTTAGSVWAVVEAVSDQPPRVVFHSFFVDGHAVTTSEGEFAAWRDGSSWHVTERKWDSLRAQATHHRRQVLAAGDHALGVQSAADFRVRYLETIRREVAQLERRGFLREAREDAAEYELAPWRAPAVAWRLLVHRSRYREAGRRSHASESRDELPTEDEARDVTSDAATNRYLGIYRRDRQRGSPLSLAGWTWRGALLFAAIVVLLGISLAAGWLEPHTAAIVLGVLLVHELGHVAMMWVFGYRDLEVLFFPVVGRLARRCRIRVPAWQEFVVLIMGPLPGMIAGWGLLVVACFVPGLPAFWQEVGFWAALINNVNLLPVLPFDGGRIVNLLVFERFPTLRVFSLLVSGLLVPASVVLLSLAGGPAVLSALWPFLVLGIFPFLALPMNRRLARTTPWAKCNLSPGDDETEALVKAFRIMVRTDSVRALERSGWTDFVDRVIRSGCARKLGLAGTAAALFFFLACLATPLWVFAGVALGESKQVRAEHRQLRQRIEALAPEVSWRGAVVTGKTRGDLEMLRDNHQDSLAGLYGNDMSFAQDQVTYDARGIFDPSEAVDKVKSLRWDEVSTWIAEDESEARQETARILVGALIGDAKEHAAAGRIGSAMTGFSRAFWAISTCEPKTSFAAWIDWLYLEHTLLQDIESVVAAQGLPEQYDRWFADTLRSRPEFEGRKMALLLLYDLQGSRLPRLPLPPPSASDGATLRDIFAEAGYPLRRSEIDREIRSERGARATPLGLRELMAAVRVVQGLPTRAEFQAGLRISDAWARSGTLDQEVLADLHHDEQRTIWMARFQRVQRLVHYRQLAVAAFEMELAARNPPDPDAPPTTFPAFPVPAVLVRAPGHKFALTSEAPDGTRLLFRLSPHFALRHRIQ